MRRIERVVGLREQQARGPRNVGRDTTLERLEREARDAEDVAHGRYRDAEDASRSEDMGGPEEG